MAAGDKSPESFASLYLGNKRATTRKTHKLAIQEDLFGPPVSPPILKNTAPAPQIVVPQNLIVPAISTTESKEDPLEISRIPQRRVYTVREIVAEIRQQVERSHLSVWIEGEISNCRPAPSGHIYFTLKDGEAQLPVVLFRRQAQLLGIRPKDGDAVEVRGRISVYESRGQLQVIAETLELRGAGALEQAFKRLKAKLQAEGLFALDLKHPLPAFPRCIGIVTSEYGAVIRDIINVVRRRHARLNIIVYPAPMQGASCAGTVANGVRFFNRHAGLVEVIILARGGGSLEDLAGFNDEGLARAIAGSELPVVSAIGHETDFTITDFVADLRAPTPSAAAELVTAAQHQVEERVWSLEQRVHRAGRYQLMMARQRFLRLSAEAVLIRLRDAIGRRVQHLDELHRRLEVAFTRRSRTTEQRLVLLTERLRRHDPTSRLALARRRFQIATQVLERLQASLVRERRARLDRAAMRLEALSPLAVLSRGYALVYDEAGHLLRNTAAIEPGQSIRARLATGSILATVKEITR